MIIENYHICAPQIYGTILVEYVQSLNKIVSPWITHTFVDDEDFFQDLINMCYVYEDIKTLCNKQQFTTNSKGQALEMKPFNLYWLKP